VANPKLKFKMKKLIKLTCLALFISLTTTSCSKDDDSSESFSNTIQHDQEEINITSSLIEDYGADETYYNYDFTLSGSLGDVPYEFYVELLSKGTNEFKTGIFKYVSELPSDSDDFYYTDGYLEFGDTTLYIKAGNITVSGEGNNYSISGILTLENDEVVTINYSGSFTITNGQG
tara:strand:- start:12296 stop:12820 length:525 start_codon:yes stop_codon:yes gene_type:complete